LKFIVYFLLFIPAFTYAKVYNVPRGEDFFIPKPIGFISYSITSGTNLEVTEKDNSLKITPLRSGKSLIQLISTSNGIDSHTITVDYSFSKNKKEDRSKEHFQMNGTLFSRKSSTIDETEGNLNANAKYNFSKDTSVSTSFVVKDLYNDETREFETNGFTFRKKDFTYQYGKTASEESYLDIFLIDKKSLRESHSVSYVDKKYSLGVQTGVDDSGENLYNTNGRYSLGKYDLKLNVVSDGVALAGIEHNTRFHSRSFSSGYFKNKQIYQVANTQFFNSNTNDFALRSFTTSLDVAPDGALRSDENSQNWQTNGSFDMASKGDTSYFFRESFSLNHLQTKNNNLTLGFNTPFIQNSYSYSLIRGEEVSTDTLGSTLSFKFLNEKNNKLSLDNSYTQELGDSQYTFSSTLNKATIEGSRGIGLIITKREKLLKQISLKNRFISDSISFENSLKYPIQGDETTIDTTITKKVNESHSISGGVSLTFNEDFNQVATLNYSFHFGSKSNPLGFLSQIGSDQAYGRIYIDENNNKEYDIGEELLKDIRLYLVDSRGIEVDKTITDSDGIYKFTLDKNTEYTLKVDESSFTKNYLMINFTSLDIYSRGDKDFITDIAVIEVKKIKVSVKNTFDNSYPPGIGFTILCENGFSYVDRTYLDVNSIDVPQESKCYAELAVDNPLISFSLEDENKFPLVGDSINIEIEAERGLVGEIKEGKWVKYKNKKYKSDEGYYKILFNKAGTHGIELPKKCSSKNKTFSFDENEYRMVYMNIDCK
jgi:hypothetical protein